MDSRPVRANRGVRTTPITEEQKQKELNFYNEMFGNIEQSDEEDSEVQLEDVFHTMSRKEKANANCQNYPYSRGCHYFHNLLTYPRIDNSSYVQDIHPYGTYNDSRVKQLFGSEVFNRKYIGLPKRQQSQDVNDKNVCHEYLFKNQDAKWKLDQQIYQLKYIQKHPQILEGTACKNYYFLKRDIQLFPLYAPETSMQDKLLLLKSKIQFLEHRRQKLQQEFFTQDDLFYHSSLNQKFFNQKEEQEASFNIQNIIVEAICMSEINDQIFVEGAEEDTAKIGVLFSIFSTLDIDQVHPAYPTEFEQYLNVGRKQQQIPPSFIMSFTNKQYLDWVGQVLSIRILQTQGDTALLQLKKIWNKLFNQQLVYIQQYTSIQKQQYIEAIKTVATNFKQQKQKLSLFHPILPKPSAANYDFYFQQKQQTNQLSAKEYIVLYFIYYLYERVGILNLDYRLVGNVLFRKYQYKLCEKIGSVVASVQLTLKKCIQTVMQNIIQTQVPIEIHSEYLAQNSTMMIWIISKEGFEGLVQQQGEQQQDVNEDDNDQDQQQDEQQDSENEQNEQSGSRNDSNHDIDEYEKPKKKFRLQ